MKFPRSLTREHMPELQATLAGLSAAGDETVCLDLSGVKELDSAGLAALTACVKRLRARGVDVRVSGTSPSVARMMKLFAAPDGTPPATSTSPRTAQTIAGDVGALTWSVALTFAVTAANAFGFLWQDLVRRRLDLRQVAIELTTMGARAIGVVGLIAFLVGGTMALQSAVQLRQFGANIFVVDLVSISMTRELGPLMAAIVVAGRSGSAIAAEVGTMVITEEMDALRTMGIHPTRFVVVPKLVALTIAQPLITMFTNAIGIFGGLLVGVFYLDIGAESFLVRLAETLYLKDLLTGLFKSVVFAQVIVLVGAVTGARTKGGADAVGRSTTQSVVAGIFLVILVDAVASLVFYFGA